MAGFVSSLTKGSFQNWLRGALGVLFAKDVLTDFVRTELTQFQTDLLQLIWTSNGIPAGTVCNVCTTINLQKGQTCPNRICDALMKAIRQEHRFNNPSWKNTDAQLWCIDAFELSKCFMPPDEYSGTRTFEDTDFYGTLSVIINNRRFQGKFVAKTPTIAICKKAREIGRLICHSPDLLLADADLEQYIRDMIILLSDPTCLASDPKAQAAVNKLNQLQTNTLTIQANDVTQIIPDNTERSISRQHQSVLQDITSHLCKVNTALITEIDKIIKAKLTAPNQKKITSKQIQPEIGVHTNQKKQDIARRTDQTKQDIKVYEDQNKQQVDVHTDRKKQDVDVDLYQYFENYIDRKKKEVSKITDSRKKENNQLKEEEYAGFQKDLIKFYRQEHSMASVSPLVEEHEVPLVEFYVKPPLVAIDHGFGKPDKTQVLSYEQLFCRGMEKVNTNIYVTSNAGMGKTSFCKHICMTWCQAHNPDMLLNNKFKPDDIQAMLGFKFLFYITLRDVHRSQCHLDDLIESFVKESLPNRSNYPLHQIINDKPILAVVDGLDEWTHPEKCDKRKNENDIPHRKYRENWTIITTTRSWKFEVLHLPSNHSHIELNELDERSSYELVKNAIDVLNMKFKSLKTVEKFINTTSQLKLGEIRKIPYLHLHCLCLWYDGRTIGKSKCEIYSNILELTLKRGTQKLQPQSFPDPTHEKRARIPKCLEDNEYCVQHQSLLLKSGELAFFALFGSENRQMLVVDYKFATNYLKPDELKYCLKLGLLSQNKVYGLVSMRNSNISFQHKTIQEYLAAFYIQSTILDASSAGQNVHQLVVRTCGTLSRILEMSEVFIFLSGLRSEACRDISWQLINTVNDDENTQRYRSRFDFKLSNADFNVTLKYQTLLVDCVEEMELSRQDFYPLPLQDVIITKQSKEAQYMSFMQKLIQGNSGGIKSLHVNECQTTEEAKDVLNRLDLQYFHSLERLCLRTVAMQPDVEKLLNQSVNTLRRLLIYNTRIKEGKYVTESTVFSQVCSDTVLSMSLLKSLFLGYLKVTHDQLEKMTSFLTSHVTMTQINMERITCSDHDKSCPGVQFHLSGHDNLQLLGLVDVPVFQLQVNTQHLEECLIGRLPSIVITSCLNSLLAALNLHRLSCSDLGDAEILSLIATIPALLQLEYLIIIRTNLADNKLYLKTDMTKLKNIDLHKVSMTSSSFQALVDTICLLSQSVTVHLRDCTVTPYEEYETLKTNIRRSDTIAVINDGMDSANRNVFGFQTVNLS